MQAIETAMSFSLDSTTAAVATIAGCPTDGRSYANEQTLSGFNVEKPANVSRDKDDHADENDRGKQNPKADSNQVVEVQASTQENDSKREESLDHNVNPGLEPGRCRYEIPKR